MTRSARKRIGHAVLTVVLLLATQFAVASELCRGLMLVGTETNRAAQIVVQVRGVTDASAAMQPCCEMQAMPARICLAALTGAQFVVLASGPVPLPDLAPPSRVSGTLALVNFALAAIPIPAAWAGPPPQPTYLVFGRFLS